MTTLLPVLCPEGCSSNWFYVASAVDLVVGGAALVSLWRQLRRSPAITST